MMNKIYISNMEFFAFHGHYNEEKLAGNKFNIDIVLFTDTTKAQKSDNLDDALNYQTAYAIIKEIVTGTKSNLLENLAENVLNALFAEFKTLVKAKIKISKLNPPMGGHIGAVGVEIIKEKA